MNKRDLKADLELCNQYKRLDKFGTSNFENFKRAGVVRSRFLESAKEGWPHALERAIGAESLVRELTNELENLFQLHESEPVMDWKERYIVRQLLYKAKEALNAD